MDAEIAKLDCTTSGFDEQYGNALNYIHYEIDTAVLKNELVKYANLIGMADIAELITPGHIGVEGKIAYCLNRGARLKESSVERIPKMLTEYKNKLSKEIDFSWESIALSSHGKSVLAYVDCYSHIDNAKTRVLLGKMPARDLAATVRKIVSDKAHGKTIVARQLLEHYRDALVEAKTDTSITDWVKPLTTVVDTLGLLVNNRASVKAGAKGAKARRLANTLEQSDRKGEKAAAKVTYKDEDIDLGISSIDPTNLVGAEAAVIYNTKTRHCEVYFAETGKRLSVHGSRITNYDEKKSTGKTLRNPETDLPHWNRATTVRRLEVLLSQVNGKNWDLAGKFNRNTMVLKVL
jgi:hypothetical protein